MSAHEEGQSMNTSTAFNNTKGNTHNHGRTHQPHTHLNNRHHPQNYRGHSNIGKTLPTDNRMRRDIPLLTRPTQHINTQQSQDPRNIHPPQTATNDRPHLGLTVTCDKSGIPHNSSKPIARK